MHKKESSFVQGDDRRVGESKFRVIKCIRWPDRVDAIYVTLYNVVHNSTQSVRGLVPQWNMVSVLKFPNWRGQLPDCADFNVANANKPTLIPDFVLILMQTNIFMVWFCLRKSSKP